MSDTKTTQAYPPEVEKGQTLSIQELERILGVTFPHPKWWSKLLNLRNRIYRDRERKELPQVTIRTEQFALVVCTDAEAASYNRLMGKRGLVRFAKASLRNMAVDDSKLSAGERDVHRRTILRQAMILGGIRSAQHRKPPELPAPERVTPKMISGDRTSTTETPNP